MQSLNNIMNRKILVVVAHPDDETLWFYQSLKKLRQQNLVEILCFTYTAISKRGKELLELSKNIGLKVHFGHCEDFGMTKLLQNLEFGISKVFSKNNYDLIITHPPHGGEKPHPHHIQVYLVLKKICKEQFIQFGFFSEQKILQPFNDANYKFSFKKRKYVFLRATKSRKLLSEESFIKRWQFWYSVNKLIWSDYSNYEGFEIEVDREDKQRALNVFKTQIHFLKEYNAYFKNVEFLYLEPKPQRNTEVLALDMYDQSAVNLFRS